MPPPEPLDPPVGDVVPYPNDILALGRNRWLTITGRIITEPSGDPCKLKPNTLAFWEAAALRGTGKRLSELLLGGLNPRRHNIDGLSDELDMLEWLQFEAEELLAAEPESEQASRHVEALKDRINRLKTDMVIVFGGDVDRVE